jgi:hypothetical protein
MRFYQTKFSQVGLLTLGFILLFTLNFCGPQLDKNKINEGYIEYSIKYLENNMEKNIPTKLLPKKMKLKFRNNKSIRNIEGFMGLFSLTIITDHKKSISTSLLKVIGKKYYYKAEPGEKSFCFHPLAEDMDVKTLPGVGKKIAGMRCKKGKVSFETSNIEPFLFYYTDEIGLPNPNYANPYENIDGVLMQFQVKLNKLRMELTANEVYTNEVSNNEFEIPEGFKRVTKNDMEEILSTLME